MRIALLALLMLGCRGAAPEDCVPRDGEADPDTPPYAVCVEMDASYDGQAGSGLDAHAEDTLDLWRQAGLLRLGEVVWVADDQVMCVYQPLCG